MGASAATGWLLGCALLGLALSVVLERGLRPRLPWARPWTAWCVHAGLLLLGHALLAGLLGRAGFAMAMLLALLLTLVLVNNAKYQALREPFVFQDYEYFTDALRYPRLYIPFLGWWKFLAATAGFVAAVLLGWWLEPPPVQRWQWAGYGGAVLGLGLLGLALLWLGGRRHWPLTWQPEADLRALGLLACLWHYARAGRQRPAVAGPFAVAPAIRPASAAALPDLVAVQSESFFDPRPLFAGIRPQWLEPLDALQAQAFLQGDLQVPAWGANTVRTEAAFLTGLAGEQLGVHRFNPYRAVAAGWPVAGLARYLQSLGYYTVCIHPYPAGFYLRDRVLPRLGFDAFWDIRRFDPAQRFGPYVSDAAVAEVMTELLQQRPGLATGQPLFVLAITMENHGPLHLEQVAAGDVQRLYHQPPPAGCEDLTIYLRHLHHANQMLERLHQTLARSERPASLCWYGDHVPIMPQVYQALGTPAGQVPYACWANAGAQALLPPELVAAQGSGRPQPCTAHALSRRWLAALGLFPAEG